ncbi:MAG: aminotransferase class I/II-fold pyridoxal phosphate-dependent enzyme [Nocardioides sp.]
MPDTGPLGLDPLGLAAGAPLLAAWLKETAAPTTYFLTPGHKQRLDLVGQVTSGDLAMYGGVATIRDADDAVAEAEALGAELWGADWCRYGVGGSTQGNQALAMAVGRPGQKVVVARTLHKSMLLGLVLAGLVPVWINPPVDPEFGLPQGVDPADVSRALADHPDACAVFVGDPAYVGTYADIAAVADAAHRAGVPLIVDAAWAAYFGFHPGLPPHALAAGADALVTSAHKSLPAINQATIVLARGELLDLTRLTRCFQALHTTSPSGPILASIDASRELLARHGERLLGGVIAIVAEARKRMLEVPGVTVLRGPGVDPMKFVVVLAGTGAVGYDVEADLIAKGIRVEMSDQDTIGVATSIADRADDFDVLLTELIAAIERRRDTPRPLGTAVSWTVRPEVVVSPREAFFGELEVVDAERASGRVSAELVAPYPPGIPVLAPGERIQADTVSRLQEMRAAGGRIAYAADPSLRTLQVLAEPSAAG